MRIWNARHTGAHASREHADRIVPGSGSNERDAPIDTSSRVMNAFSKSSARSYAFSCRRHLILWSAP